MMTVPRSRALLDVPTMAFHVGEVESRTSAEVVLACVERSDDWPEARWVGGACGLLVGLVAALALPWRFSDEALVAAALLGFAAGWRLVRSRPALERRLVPRAALVRRIELSARAAFQKAELHRTRDATALLVYLSIHEHGAALIADRTVRLAMGEEEWAVHRARFEALLASGERIEKELARALQLLGDDLEKALPRAESDIDELPAMLEVSL
jgi:putative membrane protein